MRGRAPLAPTTDTPTPAPRPADPAWAVPHVPEPGHDRREWHVQTMRGMFEDPALAHDGWDRVWHTELRQTSASGADDRTWFAVNRQALPGTNVHPCMHFCGWDHADDHGHKVKGAPLQLCVYAALWREATVPWTMGCHWATYTEWTQPRVLERVWAVAARCTDFGDFGPLPLDGEEDAALKLSADLRAKRGWTRRSAILAALPDDAPNAFLRNLNRPRPGLSWEDYQDVRVLERAEHLCWEQAEDDLPWPEFAPRRRGAEDRRPARPQALSLFDAEVSARAR